MRRLTGIDIISECAYELLLAASAMDVTFNVSIPWPLLISSDLARDMGGLPELVRHYGHDEGPYIW